MAELKSDAVFLCKRCGRAVCVNHLSTEIPDPEGELLYALLRALGKNALCDECKERKNWYYTNGRAEDWEAGRP